MRPEEEIALVRRLMQDSQGLMERSGDHFVAWGALVSAALLLTYTAVWLEWRPITIPMTWIVAIALGWAYSTWSRHRAGVRASATTFGGRMLTAIWVGVGVSLTLIGLLGAVSGAVPRGSIPGLMASLLGTGYFVSSYVYRMNWVRWLALAWWGGAALMLLWQGTHTLLLLMAMTIAFEVVPGIVLLRREIRSVPAMAE